jgi:TolB protein
LGAARTASIQREGVITIPHGGKEAGVRGTIGWRKRTFGVALGLATIAGALIATEPVRAGQANGKIAFVSQRDGFFDLYLMNPDGTGQTGLTSDRTFDGDPAWSPDGSKLAFFGVCDGLHFGICVMNADGTGRILVTTNSNDGEPTWSPDGTRIAFTRGGCCDSDIYAIDVDGSDETNLTNNPDREEFAPDWSPDGTTIAFSRFHFEGPTTIYEIYVMNPDGTGQTNIRTDTIQNIDPDWSPDGARIAFQRGFDIYVMNADGSGSTNVTSSPFPNDFNFSPVWSPDGTQIAFGNGFNDSAEIHVINADGSDRTELTSNSAFDGTPAWQPVPFEGEHPSCAGVVANPSVILPPSRDVFRLVTVAGAADPDGDPITLMITRVTQDEPLTTQGDDTTPDARLVGATDQVELRAERNPKGDGRVYRLRYVVSDGRGGSCRGLVTVSVPRHRNEPATDSAPPSFDSFGP